MTSAVFVSNLNEFHLMPQVFISYAREDIEMAKRLRNDLHDAGVSAWLDILDLLPGESWEVAIRKSIKESSFFIALLSTKSVGKRGYVQKELREALRVAEEFPQDEVFIIPVRIDECNPPHEGLRALQRVDLFPSFDGGFEKLRRVFKPESEQTFDGVARQGKLVTLIGDRGYGFIQNDDCNKHVFFLFKDFNSPNFPLVTVGMYVRYHLKLGPMGAVATGITLA